MEVLAWKLSNPGVTDQITLLLTMSDYRHSYLELPLRTPLSLADAIVLVKHLGLGAYKSSCVHRRGRPLVLPYREDASRRRYF